MIRAIILEDEFLVRLGLRTVIDWEKEGYEVVGEGKDGLEGLALYEAHRPQLIITDIRMPRLSGMEVMEKIRREDKQVKFIIISACDEFEFAKEAIRLGVKYYCLKGSMMDSELVTILRQLRVEIEGEQTQYIRDKKRRYLSYSHIKKEIDKRQQLYVLYTTCSNQELEEKLIELGAEILGNIEEKENYYILNIGGEKRAFVERLNIFLQKANWSVKMGMSERLGDKDDIKKYGQQALLSAQRMLFKKQKRVFEYEENIDDVSSYRYKQDVEGFYTAMIRRQYECAEEILQVIYHQVKESESMKLLHRVVYKLVGIMGDMDRGVVEGQLYQRLLSLEDINEIWEYFRKWIDEQAKREGISVEKNSYYISTIKDYIETHYTQQMRVSEIAKEVHLSSSYMGKLFYIEVGVHLKDYIMSVRLEKAAKLLKTKGISIGDVAYQVGISDTNYFSKVFKKYYGVSPSKYIEV